MEIKKHPTREMLQQYILEELTEEDEIKIGEHIATCQKCEKLVRDECRRKLILESWRAQTHGQVYWQKKIKEALKIVQKSTETSLLRERLKVWLEKWEGKVGGIIQVILEGAKKEGKVITNFPHTLLAPPSWIFKEVVTVGGTESEKKEIIVTTEEQPEIEVIVNTSKEKVLIQIKKREEIPLVLLISEKGNPVVVQPEPIEGTNYYIATFENLTPGKYICVLEPNQK